MGLSGDWMDNNIDKLIDPFNIVINAYKCSVKTIHDALNFIDYLLVLFVKLSKDMKHTYQIWALLPCIYSILIIKYDKS